MNTKHTPELRVADTTGDHQFAIVDDSTGQDIAIVYNRNEQSKETAQLLAAAPELLEALQRLVKYLEWREDFIVEDHNKGEINDYGLALNAIQNATNP